MKNKQLQILKTFFGNVWQYLTVTTAVWATVQLKEKHKIKN
jgi:hypothetical protein